MGGVVTAPVGTEMGNRFVLTGDRMHSFEGSDRCFNQWEPAAGLVVFE